MKLFEETIDRKVIFQGKIVTLHHDRVRLENDSIANREVVEHPGGVCVLPLEDNGDTYTVRQFRYPFEEVVEELPAGKLDGAEDPTVGARRELSEEIGCEAGELHYLGKLLMSPGFCTEVLHMYLARDLHHGAQHPDEDEFLEVSRVSFADLVERVLTGEITDAKTVALTLKAREFLSREAGGNL